MLSRADHALLAAAAAQRSMHMLAATIVRREPIDQPGLALRRDTVASLVPTGGRNNGALRHLERRTPTAQCPVPFQKQKG